MPFPPGHYYSPVVDAEDLRQRRSRVWPSNGRAMPGVDFRATAQRDLLLRMDAFAPDFRYGERPASDPSAFYEPNGRFEGLDARMLFCLLRHLQPKAMVEVGAGFSTLLAADVNHRFLDNRINLTSIDPEAAEADPVAGLGRRVHQRVEVVDPAIFRQLDENDVLFIDSSHVSKTGSDVNHLFLEVLPQLNSGVYIHVHDIFFPEDYPENWVLEEQRSWNEQYLLHALLLFSRGFEVVFGCAWAVTHLLPEIRQVFGSAIGGGSFWIRKIA